jgi:ring-1,2-phenylacetyl-CoA epoxidase subunit PaaE
MASHFRTLNIQDIRQETSECVSIAFTIPPELEEEFRFNHGQNISIRMRINGEEIRRSYSICSSPLEKELRIAVKKVEQGRFSTFANEQLQKGDILEVLSPTGKFYTELNPGNQKNYLAFVAGSGVTPLLSIIKTTLATEPCSSFTLIYGNRNRNTIIFKEELEALKNRYLDRLSIHHILSREMTDAPINHGHINPEKAKELNKKLINLDKSDEIFICGPGEMIFTLKDWMVQKGIAPNKIHFELFNTPGENASRVKPSDNQDHNKTMGRTCRVSIKWDGTTIEFDLPFDGDSVLNGALEKGADLPFACKGGVCASCRARLIEGRVLMDSNYALEPEELEAGFILTCQSHPLTEKIKVDFDAK